MNFKLKALSLITVLTVLVSVSCKKDNKQTVTPVSKNCDSTNVQFSVVSPIFTKYNCNVCHSELKDESTGLAFMSYNSIQGALNHASNYKPMPSKDTKLTESEIKTVLAWYNKCR